MPSTSNHDPRHSLSDPLSAVLRPPANETPAEREVRVQKEVEAKKVSDAIDEQIRQEKAMLKKHKADVKVLLLGQSESGKSTTLKREFALNLVRLVLFLCCFGHCSLR